MSADRNNDPSPKRDPRQFLAPSAPWIVDALAPTAPPLTTVGHHIGGQLDLGGSRSAPVFNPATGSASAA